MMRGFSGRALVLLSGIGLAMYSPSRASAQVVGRVISALHVAPIDAAALGVTRPASIGLSAANPGIALGGGIEAPSGALSAYVGAAGGGWSLTAGYARTVRAREVWTGLHASIGAQVIAGYGNRPYDPHNQAGMNLTIPAALALGDPDRSSFTLFAAPFAEAGVTSPFLENACVRPVYCEVRRATTGLGAVGVGAGGRLALSRFALELFFPGRNDASLGLSVRLGQQGR